ncbi:MAG: hypothetical protein ACC742_10080 [Thermoanaerobaculales bacterium]
MRRKLILGWVVAALATFAGCDLVDPARPTSQPDTEVFGNLLEIEQDTENPALWTARIRVGAPRAFLSAEEASGKATPVVEKGLVATVTVGPDTVVVVADEPARLEDLAPGTEVAVLPVMGTTLTFGSTDIRLEASTLMDFATYRRWRLPGLGTGEEDGTDDPDLINSGGVELAPVPLAGGRVLYFSARLRSPATAEDGWHGARRNGLDTPEEEAASPERSYRTELAEDGWTTPQLVVFPGLEDPDRVRVTWVDAGETRALVTVAIRGEFPWVGLATRRNASSAWGPPERLDELGEDVHDAVYLRGSSSMVVFVSARGGEQTDLYLYNPKQDPPLGPLEPKISSFGNEWNPRTGPQNELFFGREDRQLVFFGGRVSSLRLPGPHRVVFTRAAPTDDGKWLFFCMPRYRPVEVDEDIYVASLTEDQRLGPPVPVDDWRP